MGGVEFFSVVTVVLTLPPCKDLAGPTSALPVEWRDAGRPSNARRAYNQGVECPGLFISMGYRRTGTGTHSGWRTHRFERLRALCTRGSGNHQTDVYKYRPARRLALLRVLRVEHLPVCAPSSQEGYPKPGAASFVQRSGNSNGKYRVRMPSWSRSSFVMVKWLAPETGIRAPGRCAAERSACRSLLSDISGGSSAVP
jgi:hypothetical protein